MNELEVVLRAKKGDREGWRELFERYFLRVFRIALFMSKSEDDAKDIAQQAFVQAFRKIKSLRKPESFGFWIYKIVRNSARLHLKREKARREISLEYFIDSLIVSYDDNSEAQLREREIEIIKELVESVPKKSIKETIRMYYIDGLDIRHIVEKQGIPESTVTTRLNRFRANYRKEIIHRILALRGSD